MKKPPEDLAQKLLEATSELVGTGFDVSIDDLAQASGIPRATLYYYFSGKDDLLTFFINDKLERISTAIAKASATEGTVVDRLRAVIKSVVAAMSEYPGLCTELPQAVSQSGRFDEVATTAERVVTAPLRDLLIEGKATGELVVPDLMTATGALAGAIMHACMMRTMLDGSIEPEALGEELASMLVDGFGAR